MIMNITTSPIQIRIQGSMGYKFLPETRRGQHNARTFKILQAVTAECMAELGNNILISTCIYRGGGGVYTPA